MVGMTESVLAELDHRGSHVRVSMVHMPALNTVQFNWVRSKLPRHPQPVPPIYQPEVGARAVRRVVQHPRRNTWVGTPTAATILGNRLAPRLLDWYLGRTGYDGQQTSDHRRLPSLGPGDMPRGPHRRGSPGSGPRSDCARARPATHRRGVRPRASRRPRRRRPSRRRDACPDRGSQSAPRAGRKETTTNCD
jgi:hypothetical protein